MLNTLTEQLAVLDAHFLIVDPSHDWPRYIQRLRDHLWFKGLPTHRTRLPPDWSGENIGAFLGWVTTPGKSELCFMSPLSSGYQLVFLANPQQVYTLFASATSSPECPALDSQILCLPSLPRRNLDISWSTSQLASNCIIALLAIGTCVLIGILFDLTVVPYLPYPFLLSLCLVVTSIVLMAILGSRTRLLGRIQCHLFAFTNYTALFARLLSIGSTPVNLPSHLSFFPTFQKLSQSLLGQTLAKQGLLLWGTLSISVLATLLIIGPISLALVYSGTSLLILATTASEFYSGFSRRRSEAALSMMSLRNLELVSSASTLRLAGASTYSQQWWHDASRHFFAVQRSRDFRGSLIQASAWLSVPATLLLLLLFLSTNLEAIHTFGHLLRLICVFGVGLFSMHRIAESCLTLINSYFLSNELSEFRRILDSQPVSPKVVTRPPNHSGNSNLLEFKDVSYSYLGQQQYCIDRLTFAIPRGSFVAIVGPSGSGKSTVLKLILGLVQPSSGSILFSEKSLSTQSYQQWRRAIGVVSQDSTLFGTTIYEAISLGCSISLEQAWQLAELVGFAADLRAMPMGMNTVLLPGGRGLSSGQRQRLAIARALARDPKVLILDEATSALDNITQAKVMAHLTSLDATKIVVAHRLTTIQKADLILVMNNGALVESGSYTQLMSARGLFSNLMMSQDVEHGPL